MSQRILAQFKSSSDVPNAIARSDSSVNEKDTEQQHPTSHFGVTPTTAADGVARVEALQAVWGKHGKHALWAG